MRARIRHSQIDLIAEVLDSQFAWSKTRNRPRFSRHPKLGAFWPHPLIAAFYLIERLFDAEPKSLLTKYFSPYVLKLALSRLYPIYEIFDLHIHN